MGDNRYRISEAELRASTGHAPGQELVETEPDLEVPHDLPLRVTPMSPVTEIQAFGQLTNSRGPRRRAARVLGLGFLSFLVLSLAVTAYTVHRGSSTTPDASVASLCQLTDLPHATAADWDAIGAAGTRTLKGITAFNNTAGNRAVFDAAARLSGLAAGQAVKLRADPGLQAVLGTDSLFDAERSRDALVQACAG